MSSVPGTRWFQTQTWFKQSDRPEHCSRECVCGLETSLRSPVSHQVCPRRVALRHSPGVRPVQRRKARLNEVCSL